MSDALRMFKIHRQPQGEGAVKKSIQKLLDPKKDAVARLKHLKNVISNSSEAEIQPLFELHYSHIYYIFLENFLLTESNLRLKGAHRAQREELDAILEIFEQILINLPELIHQRWQYHSIDMVIKRLLHTQNSLKVRKEGMHFFLLWLRTLQENALPQTLLLYACLVPGFPPPTFSDGKPYSLEWLVNVPINEEYGVHQVEIASLVPPSSGEKTPSDVTKFFLDALLEFMVLKSHALQWKQEHKMAKQCFSFLWNLFKENYLPHAFPDFDHSTSIYNPVLTLPEPRDSVNYVLNVSDSGSIDPRIEVASGCSMLSSRVSIIKWIVSFTTQLDKSETLVKRPDATVEALHRQVLKQLQEIHVSNNEKPSDPSEIRPNASNSSSAPPQHINISAVQQHDTDASNSNTSTLTEKEPSISSLSSLDDKLRSIASVEETLVRGVLYSTRENVNIVHEMFRQAFMLPLTEVPTMRRVVKVYQEWIQDGEIPVFMEDEDDEEAVSSEDNGAESKSNHLSTQVSSNSLRNVSYIRGQLNPVIDEAHSVQVRGGNQSTLQLFVTNSAHVFLVEPPPNATKLLETQVDVCKRVLNLYRFMVMNVPLSDITWRQLLRVLLHVTRSMLQDVSDEEIEMGKFHTVASRLAGPVFQTLIVSWIKANLFVHVSRDLWDELVEVLSSLTQWEELITEWAKNMETMTRVLARHVYKLELQDLPLDRLTEQKHKKQKKGPGNKGTKQFGGMLSERSFSRGWSRDSNSLINTNLPDTDTRSRSQSSLVPRTPADKAESKFNSKAEVTDKPANKSRSSTTARILADSEDTGQVVESSAQRGASAIELPTTQSESSDSIIQPKRRSSASDISTIGKEHSLSLIRNRCDSEGINSNDSSEIQPTALTNGHHVAWQEPTHEVHQYAGTTDGDSTSVSVQSLEADDMFDELIHERLHAEKDTVSDEVWPGEVTSIHSQDSATIDPQWNPWADNQALQKSSISSDSNDVQDKLSMEIAIFDQVDQPNSLTDTASAAMSIPVSRQEMCTEDKSFSNSLASALSSSIISSMSPRLPTIPLSLTPPAIPARVALPAKQLSLFEIDYLSTHSDSSEITTPTSLNHDLISHSDTTSVVDGNTSDNHAPNPQPQPHYHDTNLTQNNSELHESLVEEGLTATTSIDDALSPSPSHSNHSLPEPESVTANSTPVDQTNMRSSPANIATSSLSNSTGELNQGHSSDSQSTSPSKESVVVTISTVDDSASVETCDADVAVDVAEDEEPSLIANSTENILLQNCSTPQPATEAAFAERLDDTSFEGDILNTGKDTNMSDCSILAGGNRTGWFADVAVALWRRLLGILGDVNEISNPQIHQLVFSYLLELWGILFKMRQNLGLNGDNSPAAAESSELVPPLRILAPWGFKATMALPDSHKGGKLHAYQLLCKMTVQREHDTPLEPDHLAQFYAILHDGLHSADSDIVNEIVGSCSQYFSCCLPASTLLLLDFIYACHAVAASQNLKAPRVEAQTILGSTLCFANLYHDIPVLKPDSVDPTATVCNNIKDYVVDALLTSGKKEPSSSARCVALSSTGLWLYEELTTDQPRHSRLKEAINVLLVSLKFNNRVVACVACTQLHLLTHCSEELLKTMPDMPPRIIEVMSLSVSALLNDTEAKNTDSGRQLLVALLQCILDWCMCVPLELLINTYGANTDKRLIRTVFKAMQTAALGKPGHSAKHSYSLSDLASKDFDPYLQLDKVQDPPTSIFANARPKSMARSNTAKLGKNGAVSLVAHTVLSHLNNHLGHFPLARGTSVFTCRVSEHHDVDDSPGELSAKLFDSPNVQFLIFNDSCLMSVVELPSEESSAPCGDPTAGMSSSNRCVRFIVRDAGGKYCWDSSVLYGPPDVANITRPVHCEPISTLDAEISRAAKESCQSYLNYSQEEDKRQRKVVPTPIPLYGESPVNDASDQLDQLLQYVGWTSPECQSRIGLPLNIPSPTPSCVSDDVQLRATKCLLGHHEELGGSYAESACVTSWQCGAVKPRPIVPAHSPFYHARLLCIEMGFLSRDNRDRVSLLKKNERLLRELKNLDSRHCRETHKVAVFYIAQGQEDKLSVLSNTGGSKEYEDFVSGLGWEVDLSVHTGFSGKLQTDGSTGRTSPYYATSSIEVVFHVSTRFPSNDDVARNRKLKHLGNDEVHIVWSEHHRDYRRGIIPTEFGDVLIIIYPIRHGLYRIQIIKKAEVPYFGPLFDGAIVNARVLPVLVRETAINAGRAKRSQISLYQPYYEERTRYLRLIIEQFKDDTTFEDYSAHLFCPVPQTRGARSDATKAAAPAPTRPNRTSVAAPTPEPANTNGNNSTENRSNDSQTSSTLIQFLPSDAIQVEGTQAPTDAFPTSQAPKPSGQRIAPPASHFISTSSSLLPPPPSQSSLSTSAPSGGRSSRHASGGNKGHVTFRTSLLTRNTGGGSQPHLSQKEFADFPTPPQSPPAHSHQIL
uniref:Ral GTPase-activating protein subunit alpha-1 n=1 Tax=Phallusia mammillata TaxID=59560 RepID=A0A6F9DQZ8_9ASCI|nr:ral GTPase-activating protein subunit alpha-1 [Phallusia mammillata]